MRSVFVFQRGTGTVLTQKLKLDSETLSAIPSQRSERKHSESSALRLKQRRKCYRVSPFSHGCYIENILEEIGQESRQVQLKLLHGLQRPEISEEQEKEEESEIAEEEERPNKDEGDGARDLHIDGICPNNFPDTLGDVQVLLIRVQPLVPAQGKDHTLVSRLNSSRHLRRFRSPPPLPAALDHKLNNSYSNSFSL
ncbi:hypothetical protein NQZ68_003783 [Dissostichus eleginoides]|nr:hypothetical protein NQZ68_003783 [Dissostichus eleginoides]